MAEVLCVYRQVKILKEAAAGREMPAQLRDVNIAAAGTWQFYELDSVVKLGGVEGKAQRLTVM
jgi:hypothetical protein